MSMFYKSRKLGSSVLLAACVTLAAPAFAGFEWSPPPPPSAAAPADEIPTLPSAPPTPVESAVLTDDITPVLDTNPQQRPNVVMDASYESALPSAAPSSLPSSMRTIPRGPDAVPVPAPQPQAQARINPVKGEPLRPTPFMKAAPRAGAPSMVAFPDTEGFGRDIPLALALQQIVPPGYSYAFGRNVNPGVKVSWEGGQPWNEVLQQILAPHGLMPAIDGNVVRVQSSTAPMAIPMSNDPMPVSALPEYPAPEYPSTAPMVAAAAAPVPVIPASATAPVPGYDGWRPVNDWQAEENYMPSYPRRDPAAARERLMNEAATSVQKQEPSAPGPDQLVPARTGNINAPVPLTPSKPQGKSYVQLTGLDDTAMNSLDPHEIRYWQAQQGESLRAVMTMWAAQAGVQLFWAEGGDYTLTAPVQMHGTFQNALVYILEGFAQANPHPQGQLHPNQPDGPAVLIIDHKA